jgi:hypothetical protein
MATEKMIPHIKYTMFMIFEPKNSINAPTAINGIAMTHPCF